MKSSICVHGCCKLIKWDGNSKNSSKHSRMKAGVILKDIRGRLLIVQSRNFKWGFPKGSVEAGESIVQCASRELKEETTIFIPVSKLEIKPTIKIKNLTLFVINNHPHVKINIDVLRSELGNDVTGIGWINPQCLKKNKTINLTSAFTEYLTK